MKCDHFLRQCLLLDLETRGEQILKIGAVREERTFERRGRFSAVSALLEWQTFAADARFLLGHNLLGHDLPIICGLASWLPFVKKPVIDTLYRSPLAFPEHPYHRLVKDYKLVRESLSDPVADARLAASVFRDQWRNFSALNAEAGGDMLSFYRFCFHTRTRPGRIDTTGLAAVFETLGGAVLTPAAWTEIFHRQVRNRACVGALDQVLESARTDPEKRPEFAYVLAWLRVAAGNTGILWPGAGSRCSP